MDICSNVLSLQSGIRDTAAYHQFLCAMGCRIVEIPVMSHVMVVVRASTDVVIELMYNASGIKKNVTCLTKMAPQTLMLYIVET